MKNFGLRMFAAVSLWGVAVSTPEVSAASAGVQVAVKLENRGRHRSVGLHAYRSVILP
jgi:hypothetical protein